MKKVKKFFSDFKTFIFRGNILDLAIALVVGSAFTAIVTSLVNDIIMPLICAIFGSATVDKLFFTLNGAEIYYGKFLQAVINFLLVGTVLFLVLRAVMNASNLFKKTIKEKPTRAERKELKANGVNMKNYKEVIAATKALRESKLPPKEAPKPTQEELLGEILKELKKQNKTSKKIDKKQDVE